MRMGRRADGEGFRYSFSRLSAFPQNESPSDPCNIIVGGNVSNAHFLSQLCQSVIATPSPTRILLMIFIQRACACGEDDD